MMQAACVPAQSELSSSTTSSTHRLAFHFLWYMHIALPCSSYSCMEEDKCIQHCSTVLRRLTLLSYVTLTWRSAAADGGRRAVLLVLQVSVPVSSACPFPSHFFFLISTIQIIYGPYPPAHNNAGHQTRKEIPRSQAGWDLRPHQQVQVSVIVLPRLLRPSDLELGFEWPVDPIQFLSANVNWFVGKSMWMTREAWTRPPLSLRSKQTARRIMTL